MVFMLIALSLCFASCQLQSIIRVLSDGSQCVLYLTACACMPRGLCVQMDAAGLKMAATQGDLPVSTPDLFFNPVMGTARASSTPRLGGV